MKLAKHIRKLIFVYRYDEKIVMDANRVRELLFLYGITPSLGQVRATLNKHVWFIIRTTPSIPLVQGLDY